jgi:hypothetical protein
MFAASVSNLLTGSELDAVRRRKRFSLAAPRALPRASSHASSIARSAHEALHE